MHQSGLGFGRYGSQSTLMSSDIETTTYDSRDNISEYVVDLNCQQFLLFF